jgi:hypothetical protein
VDDAAPARGQARAGRPQRRFSRGHGLEGMRRRDSKVYGGEQRKRRKSSLFLDVYPSDVSVVEAR